MGREREKGARIVLYYMEGLAGMCSVIRMHSKKKGTREDLRYCDVRTLKAQDEDHEVHVSDLKNMQDGDACH